MRFVADDLESGVEGRFWGCVVMELGWEFVGLKWYGFISFDGKLLAFVCCLIHDFCSGVCG